MPFVTVARGPPLISHMVLSLKSIQDGARGIFQYMESRMVHSPSYTIQR